VKPTVAKRLASLPPLDRANARTAAIACKICGRPAAFFDVVDFNKCAGFYYFGPAGVPVSYHRCDECGFLFTAFFDDWTQEDFRRFIYNADYRLVDPEYAGIRPRLVAEHLARFMGGMVDARILDYGAGAGQFAERMAELGFPHVTSYDPFSMPERPEGRFDIITCTEVLEHVPFPLPALQEMQALLNDGGCIILGETLQPPDIDAVRANWWYVAPRNGHVSTFADRTLVAVAEQLGMIFHRGAGHHVLRLPGDGRLAAMADRFGPAMACFRLYAPAEGEATDGFHGVEGAPGEQFRWSATTTLSWQVMVPAVPPRLVQVSIPFVHQSQQGFAGACRLEFMGNPAKVTVRDSAILAETGQIGPGPVLVTLRTPELSRPPGDQRQIGIALESPPHRASGSMSPASARNS
jgi:SAM-dependent methyltransferase